MMKKIMNGRPETNISKPDEQGMFTVVVSVKLSEGRNPLSNQQAVITVGNDKLVNRHPVSGKEIPWKTNPRGFLEFDFKRGEGSYLIKIWIDDEDPISLSPPVKLEIPKLKGFDFEKPEEIKDDEGCFNTVFTCFNDQGNSAAGTVEFETQPDHPIVVTDMKNEVLGYGEKFAIEVLEQGSSVLIHNVEGLPIRLALTGRRKIVQTMHFPVQPEPIPDRPTSFRVSNLKPDPLPDGSYILKIEPDANGKQVGGDIEFVTELPLQLYNLELEDLLAETSEEGTPIIHFFSSANGLYARLKPKVELTESRKIELHLKGTSFTKTVELLPLLKAEKTMPAKINFFHPLTYDEEEDVFLLGIQPVDHDNKLTDEEGLIRLICSKKLESVHGNFTAYNDGSLLSRNNRHIEFKVASTSGGYVIRIKFEGQTADLTVQLMNATPVFSQTFNLEKPEIKEVKTKKPVKIAPIKWYRMENNTYCLPIALIDEKDNAYGDTGSIYYSSNKKTKAGINSITNIKEVGIVDVKPFDIPAEGANLIVKFEGRTCDIFLGLECGTKTETISLC